jgi:hypothetical protein
MCLGSTYNITVFEKTFIFTVLLKLLGVWLFQYSTKYLSHFLNDN